MALPAQIRADLVLLLVTLLAAFGWIFSKEALGELPPLLFIGLRFLLAGSVLLLFSGGGWQRISEQGIGSLVMGLGCLMAVALLCWILGLNKGSHLGTGAFISSLSVVLVPVIAWSLYREPVSRNTWLSLPVAIIGLALLSLEGGFSFSSGQGWFFLAALLFALHFTLVSKQALSVPIVILTAVQLLVVGVVGITVSAWFEPWPAVVCVSLPTWGWFLASALVATSARFALLTYGQSLAPASHVALIMILEPVWTALLAAIRYGEAMSMVQFLGCGLIFSGMLIGRWNWVRKALRSLSRTQYCG